MKNINKRFEELRRHFGDTQIEFAKRLKVSQKTVSNAESSSLVNEGTIRNYIKSILSVLPNVNLSWLTDGQGNIFLEEGQENITYNTDPEISYKQKDDDNIVDFLKRQLIEKDKIIQYLMNNQKPTQTSGFSS